jgi:molecular chaperone Hsp33
VSEQDVVRRFVLQGGGVRGQWARLDHSWASVREHVDYPQPVRDLLGEATVAAVLLASTLKFEGTLTLQLQGDGAVRLMVVQCSNLYDLRALARFDADAVRADFASLAGSGQLTVTIETAANVEARYQGVVPLVGESLAAALEHYCAQSEQLPTVLRLHADEHRATGVLLQRLPATGGAPTDEHDQDQLWERAADALRHSDVELLVAADGESLARRCGAGEDVRLFTPQTVNFRCRCSHDKIVGVLRSLGEAELRGLIAEQGAVTVTCEFCQKPWRFDAIDIAELLQVMVPPAAPTRVN